MCNAKDRIRSTTFLERKLYASKNYDWIHLVNLVYECTNCPQVRLTVSDAKDRIRTCGSRRIPIGRKLYASKNYDWIHLVNLVYECTNCPQVRLTVSDAKDRIRTCGSRRIRILSLASETVSLT